MKITICGLAGTGTSTLGKELARTLEYEYLSSGDVFRSKARELGIDLNEFEELCQRDEQYDKWLDQEIAELGKTHDDIVVESRLAWHFIPDSFKVKLTCDFDTRIERIAYRDQITTDKARDLTQAREKAIRNRYQRYYGIEAFDDDDHFDMVVDSTTRPVDKLVTIVTNAFPYNS
jgi:cytidylate kinase